jgi:hypothetical protein
MSDIATAIPRLARMSIDFRPYRSPSRPHSGAVSAAVRNVAAYATPDHVVTAASEVTPRSRTYRGRIGRMRVIPTIVVNEPTAATARLRRQ